MAISIIGTNQGGVKTDGTDVTLTFSTAPQTGDHIYVWGGHFTRGGTNYGPNTANGNYAQLILTTAGVNSVGFWRLVVGTTPPTAVVCQGSGNAADGVAYGSIIVRGGDLAFDALNITTSSGINPAPGPVTTVVNGDEFLLFLAWATDAASIIDPANYVTGSVHAHATATNPMTIATNFRSQPAPGMETPAAYNSADCGNWICLTVAVMVSMPKKIALSSPTWTVPSDWTAVNRLIAIGSGGSGLSPSHGASGGGGGAFCQIANVAPSAIKAGDTLNIQIGTAGQQVVTFLKNSSNTIILQADYGRTAVVTTGVDAAGGAVANNIPAGTGFAGGDGNNTDGSGSGGGGGSGGIAGAGRSGGPGSAYGGGGGGSNGALSAQGSGGLTNKGGAGPDGTGGGAAGNATGAGGDATTGRGAGGGGGGSLVGGNTSAGKGSVHTAFDASHGSSGGGGGAGDGGTTVPGAGGDGGIYGGGAGSGNSGGTAGIGGSGLLIVAYAPPETSTVVPLGRGSM